ncbi:MAG: thiamine phosphate synthase [Bacteroidales bacterium]
MNKFLLIGISTPNFFPEEASIINKLFYMGLDFFHIRKPQIEGNELQNLIENIEPHFRSQISVHYHFQEYIISKIGGVHFSGSTMEHIHSFGDKRRSLSCHTFEEVERYKNLSYMFLSPIFPSITKPDYYSEYCLSEIKMFVQANNSLPIVALGGIDASTITTVKDMGFCGAALMGALWSNGYENALQSFETIKKRVV